MRTAILLLCCLVASPHAQSKLTVYVGPQTRDGFVDIDSGIADSIKDVKGEFVKSRLFALANSAAAADIVLTVVQRRTPGESGSIGVPIGGMTMFLPIKRRAVDSIMRFGSYEKPLTSEAEDQDSWRATAKKVVQDVTVWVEANRAALK